MKKYISLVLDENRLRFTPDGKVVVVDALRAMMGECSPEWTALYQEYEFDGSSCDQATDSQGWEVIEGMLLDYILDQEAPGRHCPEKEKEKCPA